MAIHVVKEANRCLKCKNPRCTKGCPVETPIPEMIQLFLDGKSKEAGKLLFENNPLSAVCALVCDHEKQCEGNCVQGIKGTSIHWSSIESYISERFIDAPDITAEPKNGKSAAIIGSGPAGITIATILAKRGYDITIFESRDKIGGVLRYGIPEFRLPKSLLDKYQKMLEGLGVRIRPNTTIGGSITVDSLFRDGYSAVFIGTGVWRPYSLGLEGESLGNVHYAINYLVNPDVYNLGENVAIIGAGNAAMDVARTVARHGAKNVDVYVRKLKAAASEREVDYAIADGVCFHYGMQIQKITKEGPVFCKVQYDADGNIISKGEPELRKADSTLIAIGQGPKDKIVNTTEGIEINNKGLVVVDDSGHTTHDGIFASGDVTSGAKTVVEAVKYSKLVAEAMDEYMQSLG